MLHVHIHVDPAQRFWAPPGTPEYDRPVVKATVELNNYSLHTLESIRLTVYLLDELADVIGQGECHTRTMAPESVYDAEILIPAPTQEVVLMKAVVVCGVVDTAPTLE